MTSAPIEVELTTLPIPYPEPAASIIGGHVVLYGYAIKEGTGAAGAELDIYDGQDNKGLLALPISLAAGQSVRDWFGPQGLHLRGGLFSVATGSVVGSVFVNLECDDERWQR